MERARKASSWKTVYPVCLLFAAVFLFLLTKSSPLYPLNEWVDANIYFTIGKGMMRGFVPYLNLYDQKGPVAFLIYGLASLISGTSFFGVYVIETIAFSFFLFAAYRIVALYTEKFALLVVPVCAAFILGSLSFSHGGSLEELMMPLFAWSLYDTLRYFKESYPNPVPLKMIARNALFAGIMLYGKFTLLAFYIVWMGVLAISQLMAKHVKRAFSASGLFLAVMFAVGIPFVLYFAANGALKDFYHYYFYSNIFNYSLTDESSVLSTVSIIIKSVGAWAWLVPGAKAGSCKTDREDQRAAHGRASRLRNLYGRAGLSLLWTRAHAVYGARHGALCAIAREGRAAADEKIMAQARGLCGRNGVAAGLCAADLG